MSLSWKLPGGRQTKVIECSHTVVGDVGDLEAPGAVDLVGLEVDPEASGSSGEGDGPLVGLTRLVGGDGGG